MGQLASGGPLRVCSKSCGERICSAHARRRSRGRTGWWRRFGQHEPVSCQNRPERGGWHPPETLEERCPQPPAVASVKSWVGVHQARTPARPPVRSTHVADSPFVPTDFDPPRALIDERFQLEPLGPQHNEADLAAWTSSIAHIRSTPGFPDGNWPPPTGMSLERNLQDLRRHASDFEMRSGFTFTVLDPATCDVIGCVYLYPSKSDDTDVTVQSWVRISHAELDVPLADAVLT